MLEDLGECMHQSIQRYLDDQMGVCADLPLAVREQIRAEAEGQLETIVDGVLGAVIGASKGAALPSDVPQALASQFQSLLAADPTGRAVLTDVQAFCSAVLGVRG